MEQLAMTEPWSLVGEIAKHLGVAQVSIYRWIDGRGLPAHKIGRIRKLELAEVGVRVHAEGAERREKSTA